MSQATYAVEAVNLTMRYGNFEALKSLNLRLQPGKIYGLLGRNGAGKTTLLNVLTGRIFENEGEPLIFGHRAFEHLPTLKKICFIEEKGFYSSSIRVSQVLQLAAGLYPDWDADFAERLIREFELDPRKKYKQLSRGMESALGLIIGLASRAPLTIFDEPSLGLDAVIRERFYDAVIEDIAEHPRTMIISTHLIDEVSRLFEDVIIMDSGKILLKSDAVELRDRGYYISGKEADVRAAAKDCVILSEEQFGGTLILSVFSKQELLPRPGVDIQKIPLQKLFVLLINPKIHEALQKGGVIQ